MNKICLASFLVGLLFGPNAPAGELVKFPVGPASWTVEVSASPGEDASATKPARAIVKIEVVQDQEKRHTSVTWSSGETTERWDIPSQNLILAVDPKGEPFSMLGGGLSAQALDIPFAASSLEWLDPKYQQEKNPISYQGKLCFHYKGLVKIPNLAADGGFSAPTNCEAWIDSQTQLPVAFDNGTELGTFTFPKTPPAPLTLPAKFEAVYSRYEQAMGIVRPASSR